MVELLFIALALAMDCFAVSVVCGVIVRKNEARTLLSLAFFFGLFQALMPLIGWGLTHSFHEQIEAWDHWIAFAMLTFIGGKMIRDAFRTDGEQASIRPRELKTQLSLAIATSIDALAVGISFACTDYNSLSSLTLPLVMIGIVSFLMSILGYLLGVRFGEAVNKKMRPELLGGIILLCIGIKILIEHLGAAAVPAALPPVEPEPDPVEVKLEQMSLREKVGQLFCIRPESYNAELKWETTEELASHQLQKTTARMREMSRQYPAGGIILFAHNIKDPEQLAVLMDSLHRFGGNPLFYIDEEGGRVARIANNPAFPVQHYSSMGAIGRSGEPYKARECGATIGKYLKDYGFDVDLAPVADVNTNPQNPVIGTRAFSSDPEMASRMVCAFLSGLQAEDIAGCVKHFPGHGDTRNDSHLGYVQSLKTWDEMLSCEILPFRAAIDKGVPMVMVAHISVPNVTGNGIPASLSEEILQEKLRKELGFNNIIITDGMEMGAISQHYGSGESTLLALQAGVDIILCPARYTESFDAILDAVADGTLTEARIDESVRRILKLKYQLRGEL